jgi:hypothetical protein
MLLEFLCFLPMAIQTIVLNFFSIFNSQFYICIAILFLRFLSLYFGLHSKRSPYDASGCFHSYTDPTLQCSGRAAKVFTWD